MFRFWWIQEHGSASPKWDPPPQPPLFSFIIAFLSPTCCVKLHELDVRLSGKHACSVCQMWRWENRWVINELVSVTELKLSPSTHGWMWGADSPRRISQCWTVSLWISVLEPEDLIWTWETWPHASKKKKKKVSFSSTYSYALPTESIYMSYKSVQVGEFDRSKLKGQNLTQLIHV